MFITFTMNMVNIDLRTLPSPKHSHHQVRNDPPEFRPTHPDLLIQYNTAKVKKKAVDQAKKRIIHVRYSLNKP